MKNLFRYFKTSPEVIRLAVMMYVRFPLYLRQVEDLLIERGIDICQETLGQALSGLAEQLSRTGSTGEPTRDGA